MFLYFNFKYNFLLQSKIFFLFLQILSNFKQKLHHRGVLRYIQTGRINANLTATISPASKVHSHRARRRAAHAQRIYHSLLLNSLVLIWISQSVHGINSYLNPNLYNPHDILSIPIKRICIKIVFKCPHHGYWCKSGSETVMILRCGHGYSGIIVGIRNKATTSDWLISLSRFSNASLIERIPTHVAVAALWRGRSECSDWLTCVVSCFTPSNWRWRVQSE